MKNAFLLGPEKAADFMERHRLAEEAREARCKAEAKRKDLEEGWESVTKDPL